VERVEGALDKEVFVRGLALVEMLKEGLLGDVVVGIVGALEHVLAFDDLFGSFHSRSRINNYGVSDLF
jgi:uncharacterized membrane protein YeaQ/YmgE (transglycosylase-associated protein family)